MKKKRHKTAVAMSKRIRDEARDFAQWLNSDGEAQDLFRRLVKLTAAVTKYELQRKRRSDTLEPSDPYLSYERQIDRILRRIEKRYPSQLALVNWANERGLPYFCRQSVREESLEAIDACSALEEFDELANAGAFAAFEMCALPACGNYFFAFPPQKRHCSDACQRTHYDQTPERKKANTKYQKTHYHEWLSAEAQQMQKLAARRGWSAHLPLSELKRRLRKA